MNKLSQEEIDRLGEMIFAGQKIEAIKAYRDLAGLSLLESKQFIDLLEKQLRDANPTFFQNPYSTAKPRRPSLGNMPEEDAKKMTDFIFAGQKIAAIKMYKEATGLGLKESKDVIDALEKQLREECPENFTHAAKTGCSVVLAGGVLLALAAGAMAAVWA
jgi:ribosomal protein L7/L12